MFASDRAPGPISAPRRLDAMVPARARAFAAPPPLHAARSRGAPRCTLQPPSPPPPPPPRAVVARPTPSERATVLGESDSAVVGPSADAGPSASRPPPAAVVVVPGYGAPAAEYDGLAAELRRALGDAVVVRVANVTVGTWARTLGGRPVTPVLEEVDAAVEAAAAAAGGGRVALVGHSAGGWIARIFLSRSAEYYGRVWRGADRIDTLVCLGTPQRSEEAVTRRNMMFVNDRCSGCAEPGVEYICVAGTGLTLPEARGVGAGWRFWEAGWFSRVSYRITDGGDDALVGDGIVPTSAAYLDGARNVELDGVWHSPKSPGPWYGDARAVAYWARYL